MSMSTIYVLFQGEVLVDVSDSTSAESSKQHFILYGRKGQVYAARIGDTAAYSVRECWRTGNASAAAQQLKSYSQSLTHVDDV